MSKPDLCSPINTGEKLETKIWINQWEHRLHWKEPIALSVTYRVRGVSFLHNRPSDIMDSSTNFQAPTQAAYSLWSCDKVYHKQEVCFLLYFLGQIVSLRYNPNLLDYNWSCTVINDHDWQLWNCPLVYITPSLRYLRQTSTFHVFAYKISSC